MIRETRFALIAITGSDVVVYTVPDNTVAMLKDFDICNTTAGALTVRVHVIPDGASVGTSNALYYDLSIASKATQSWRGTIVMEAGDTISVKGSGTGMTITASGTERQL